MELRMLGNVVLTMQESTVPASKPAQSILEVMVFMSKYDWQ